MARNRVFNEKNLVAGTRALNAGMSNLVSFGHQSANGTPYARSQHRNFILTSASVEEDAELNDDVIQRQIQSMFAHRGGYRRNGNMRCMVQGR
jgi:hypothetical protein